MSSPIASCCIYWDSTSRRTRSLLIPACLNSQLVWGWVPHFCFLGAGITGKSSHCLALVVVLGIQTQVCTELCWAISPVLVRHLTDSHSYIIIYLHIKTTLRLQLLGWLRYTILNNKFSIFFPSEIFFFWIGSCHLVMISRLLSNLQLSHSCLPSVRIIGVYHTPDWNVLFSSWAPYMLISRLLGTLGIEHPVPFTLCIVRCWKSAWLKLAGTGCFRTIPEACKHANA